MPATYIQEWESWAVNQLKRKKNIDPENEQYLNVQARYYLAPHQLNQTAMNDMLNTLLRYL